MNPSLLRIEELSLTLDEEETLLPQKVAKLLNLPTEKILTCDIVKKAFDSRNKSNILFVYALNVDLGNNEAFLKSFQTPKNQKNIQRYRIRLIEPFVYEIKPLPEKSTHKRPIIVGTWPSGLFCGLALALAGMKPILLERGSEVNKRVQTVHKFFTDGTLDPNCNVQFGEGGAGTFSDGKLYTLINDPRSTFVFQALVDAGAPAEIMYSARPHIGTDRLRGVVRNLRKRIISLGGEVLFDTCMTDIEIEDGKIQAVITSTGKRFETDDFVFGIGHSARDTYEMLHAKWFQIEQKPFAIGVRIEHPRKCIDQAQFWNACLHHKLPTANYKLVSHHEKNRSVYTFCMCPWGFVVPASSEAGRLTVNGMSEYSQDSINSNSALLVNVLPSDFWSDHPLAGIEFQRKWEEKAFQAGGGNHHAPAQLVGDFLKDVPSTKLWSIQSTYLPALTMTDLSLCLPDFVISALREALPQFDKKIHGFAQNDAILIGIEARSSAVLRFQRDESCESNIKGAYPAGEGAWYAWGITSSAIDWLLVAESIMRKRKKNK